MLEGKKMLYKKYIITKSLIVNLRVVLSNIIVQNIPTKMLIIQDKQKISTVSE